MSRSKQVECYVCPSFIKKERAKVLSFLRADVDEGGSPSIIFDDQQIVVIVTL